MMWRVRTTLPDRPGALASLAEHCGLNDVNILGLQIFPQVDGVTDELVLSTPADWGITEIAVLVERAGGRGVTVAPCTEAALVDQPTRFVQAARTIIAQPAAFPEVAARLFDADADPPGDLAAVQDVMDLDVAGCSVQVRRTAPFTATELARGAALAQLVEDVLERSRTRSTPPAGRRLGAGAPSVYVVAGEEVLATVEGAVVGVATVRPEAEEAGLREVTVQVDPAWRRRGIGTRLLSRSLGLAADLGADEVVLHTRVDNQAVLPMVLAAGIRGRIRMSAQDLTVRVRVGARTRSRAGTPP